MTMRRLAMGFLLVGVAACGGSSDEPQGDTGSSGAGIDPCTLLSASEVAAVLPGADTGYVTARGRELMEGVRQYQCTYTDPQTNLFLVAFDVATTESQFEAIKPGDAARYVRELGAHAVDVGDGGWWLQRKNGPLELRAAQARTSIHLETNAPDAASRAEAFVAAGVALAARLE